MLHRDQFIVILQPGLLEVRVETDRARFLVRRSHTGRPMNGQRLTTSHCSDPKLVILVYGGLTNGNRNRALSARQKRLPLAWLVEGDVGVDGR